MKILKKTIVLALFLNLLVSCTIDDITEELETISIENVQATGEEGTILDETEKG